MTIEVGIDSSALVKGVEEGTRALRALSDALGKLDKASLTRLKTEIESLKGSPLQAVQTIAKSMESTLSGAFDSIGRIQPKKLQDIAKQLKADGNAIARVLQDTNEAIAKQAEASARALEDANNNLDKKLSVRQKAIKAATKAYEDMVMGDPERRVTPRGEAALYRMMQAGAQMSPTHTTIAKSWAQSYRDEAKEYLEAVATVHAVQKELNKKGFNQSSAYAKAMVDYEIDQQRIRSQAFDAIEKAEIKRKRGVNSAFAALEKEQVRLKEDQEKRAWAVHERSVKAEEVSLAAQTRREIAYNTLRNNLQQQSAANREAARQAKALADDREFAREISYLKARYEISKTLSL